MVLDTLDSMISPQWMSQAECRESDPNLFYPSATGRWSERRIREAITICRRCPVITQCLAWAVEIKDGHAILGGTTPDQRTRMLAGKEAA